MPSFIYHRTDSEGIDLVEAAIGQDGMQLANGKKQNILFR